MKYIEHKRPSFAWAEPLQGKGVLDVTRAGDKLLITGRFPGFGKLDHPSDLVRQYQIARNNRSVGKGSTSKDSPHVRFANANTDQALIAFVRNFGPLVASSVKLSNETPPLLTATQSLAELRDEQTIYRAAFSLVVELRQSQFSHVSAQGLIQTIATHVTRWPEQWARERSERNAEPFWKLSGASLKRIRDLSSAKPDILLLRSLDGRIVLCELLNAFRAMAFPNPLEMHAAILYGNRPLLYSILRLEFLHPHDTGVCANTRCRQFFEVERAGQTFCTPLCSQQQRQRDYWHNRGKKQRAKRIKKRRTGLRFTGVA